MKKLVLFAAVCVLVYAFIQVNRTAAVQRANAAEVEQLRQKANDFKRAAGDLPPAEAARRWMDLLDTYLTFSSQQIDLEHIPEKRFDLGIIITALPPVGAWDALSTLAAERKSASPPVDDAVRLLVAVLRGDEASRMQALEKLHESAPSLKSSQRHMSDHFIRQTIDEIAALTASDDSAIAIFERKLEDLEKTTSDHANLSVPDLVRFTDSQTAQALLLRVLQANPRSVSIEGAETRSLAASLALQHIDVLKRPFWDLVQSLDHAPLYEAMLKKFPAENGFEFEEATNVFVLALVASDRVEEAVRLVEAQAAKGKQDAVDMHGETLDQMEQSGLGDKVLAFLRHLLIQKPELPYWEVFVELSARQKASAQALETLQACLARRDLSPEIRQTIQSHLYLALLSADKRNEGIQVLRGLVKADPSKSPRVDNLMDLCENLASLGRLLNRADLVDEALSTAARLVDFTRTTGDEHAECVNSYVELLLEHRDGREAEKILENNMGIITKSTGNWPSEDTHQSLMLLMQVYNKAGRFADTLGVLEKSPRWDVPDLAWVEEPFKSKVSVLQLAAQALTETGRTEDARRVALRAVQSHPGQDSAYELLLRVGADQPIDTLLDQLARRDRFQERPLIWKARFLLDAGKVDEAEKAVRAAIAIDPSDGEQGKGDRMRAYAVLAEVLEKKGDAETAKIMRGAVSAIRKSEDADDWWRAGLLSEAVRRYETALLDFADAYCIQSRLALRYSRMGQLDKAEQHYIRAFELMPDSFGRVESHCFGCESAFRGQLAQNAAEKVFSHLASVPPVKPQVHYLLGYLREEQGRNTEAADAYRQAVKADPDYLNAWSKLAGLAEKVQMTRDESEKAALAIFRLDPGGLHSQAKLGELRDLRQLWQTLLETETAMPAPETGPLFTLAATKARLDSRGTDDSRGGRMPRRHPRHDNEIRQHLAENPLVRVVSQLVEAVNRH